MHRRWHGCGRRVRAGLSRLAKDGTSSARAAPGCFAPEDLSEEQRQLGKTAGKFGREEVAPVPSRIDEGEHALVAELLRRSGELGLLGTEVPEEYGGLAPDKATNVLIAEELGGRVASVTGSPPRRRARRRRAETTSRDVAWAFCTEPRVIVVHRSYCARDPAFCSMTPRSASTPSIAGSTR